MYPDAATVGDGRFSFVDGRSQHELTTWTSLGKAVMELAAHSVETVVVSIDETGMRMVNRVGIRVYLDIGPGGLTPSAFTMSDVVAPPNLARLRCPARSEQAGPGQERR